MSFEKSNKSFWNNSRRFNLKLLIGTLLVFKKLFMEEQKGTNPIIFI